MDRHGCSSGAASSGEKRSRVPSLQRRVDPSTSSMGDMFAIPDNHPAEPDNDEEEPLHIKRPKTFMDFVKLRAEDLEATDYCQTFDYVNETNGWTGSLQLAWRYDSEENECLTSCRYWSHEEQAAFDFDFCPWHGRWQCLKQLGQIGLRIYFDFKGSEESLHRNDKWTTVWARPERPWTYKGTDYQQRTVCLRAASPIMCLADHLGRPECGAPLLPSTTGGLPWKRRS